MEKNNKGIVPKEIKHKEEKPLDCSCNGETRKHNAR